VNLFIQESAEHDILNRFEWYAKKGLFDVARRFRAASFAAIDGLVAMPAAGPPRMISNPRLAGPRTRPVKGFDDFRV
jgi:plasmid stabilization system protein ParE